MSTDVSVPPPAIWAQRNDVIYLTLNVECLDPTFKFTEDSMYFKGVGLPEKKNLEVTINFYSKINPDKVVSKNTSRCIEFVISKADTNASYWPKLTNDKNKPHWLKVDFNRWKDEGSDDENNKGDNGLSLEDMLRSTNENKLSFDDLDDDQEDSDDEAMPGLTEDKDEKEEEK
ncbi:uncharacterized protein CG16817 [Topomyia yanbarensis]|uniref:uncharacterized protein CG16817 n=1 Tax=Topomyia yanbarensis TaxID=2498891 RepID=UPI00273AF9A0|nr:uncharacterized protein CG16817 [Topomyia yanbarensis]